MLCLAPLMCCFQEMPASASLPEVPALRLHPPDPFPLSRDQEERCWDWCDWAMCGDWGQTPMVMSGGRRVLGRAGIGSAQMGSSSQSQHINRQAQRAGKAKDKLPQRVAEATESQWQEDKRCKTPRYGDQQQQAGTVGSASPCTDILAAPDHVFHAAASLGGAGLLAGPLVQDFPALTSALPRCTQPRQPGGLELVPLPALSRRAQPSTNQECLFKIIWGRKEKKNKPLRRAREALRQQTSMSVILSFKRAVRTGLCLIK